MRKLVVGLCFLLTTACAGTPPFAGYVIAKTALKSARKVGAEDHAGPYWTKALRHYQRGRNSFQDRDYISAERFFNESIKWSEKAENLSRFKISTGQGV